MQRITQCSKTKVLAGNEQEPCAWFVRDVLLCQFAVSSFLVDMYYFMFDAFLSEVFLFFSIFI